MSAVGRPRDPSRSTVVARLLAGDRPKLIASDLRVSATSVRKWAGQSGLARVYLTQGERAFVAGLRAKGGVA